jgi:hypothetical protein
MTDRREGLPALGTPEEQPTPEGDDDFADEHDATAVDQGVTAGRDVGEPESPEGWSGLDREPLP